MDSATIRNLDELLNGYINNNFTIKEYKTGRLTLPGENYGSLMLTVKIILRKEDDADDDTLNIVAKMCPPNEWLKKMFNIETTFKREIAMYNVIFPALTAFQADQKIVDVISCFPECYGARTSLDRLSETVDDDAVLLLENLKLSGFELVDRTVGFDLDTAKLILKDLAVFHAVPLALKMSKPDFFVKNIMPHLEKLEVFSCISNDVQEMLLVSILNAAKLNEDCTPLIPKIKEAMELCSINVQTSHVPREPFATINHNDLWVNNTMVKFDGDEPVASKIIDFQLIDYGSPANDIVFFLFSSVQKQVLDDHYDDLLMWYYDNFILTLKQLKCDIAPFTFELFEEEIDECAKHRQFFHIMVMLRPIFAPKGTAKELSEMNEDDMINDDHMDDAYKNKVAEVALKFAKKGWL